VSSPFPNPPASTDALFAPMSGDVVLTVMISALVTMKVRADLWPKEGVLISCMTVVANAISGAINNRIAATKAGWLPTAVGAWLTWLAFYMYGVIRTAATFANGPVTLTNSGGSTFSYAPFTATFQHSTTKATYVNIDAISLPPGPLTTVTVQVQANVQGSASNAQPGDVTVLVTAMPGVSCTNLQPILGSDEQSDPSLQKLCWNSIAANSAYGPRQSFEYAIQTAKNSVTGAAVNINRWTPPKPSHTGEVFIWVASPQGVPLTTDVTGVATNIEAIARPQGVVVTVQGAVAQPITDTLTVYVTATPGVSATDVQQAVQTALSTFFEDYPIGGRVGPVGITGLFANAIVGACFGAWPGIFDVVGAVDHVMNIANVTINQTTVNVILVSP
jgi:hypothetical protein